MKQKLKSLQIHMLLPVVVMTLFIVTMLTTLFSRAYISMILQQEQEVNAASFDTISRSITPLIASSIGEVRNILSDSRVSDYARLQYTSEVNLIHARISCRDYLRTEIARHEGIFGLLFMRKDGSIFGALPEGNFFLDDPEENPLSEDMKAQILNAPRGQMIWAGPVPGAALYGFENAKTPQNIMIAAWKSVDVNYGECYVMVLMDETIFEKLFETMQDGKSTWHLFTAEQTEIYHTGQDACSNPERLISESNSETVFNDENGNPVSAFSMTMKSPAWTLVREVPMENYEQVIRRVRGAICLIAIVVLLIALAIYRLWLKGFMRQFNLLLKGIIRMGEGELEPMASVPYTIQEFETMQQEIDRTSLALNQQMDTIRRMEREQMEQENMIKEQERIVKELSTARQIQKSVLPHIFPPFPDRAEIDLFATMDPAKDVGGDFYDFYFIDEDHLCLVIADVSGKGIPAALFMMLSKRILEDLARQERTPSTILEKANDLLCDNNQAEMFVTVWLGILEISTGKLTAANAGHEFPAICEKGGSFELYKDTHGFVVGGMEGVHYKGYDLQLNPGDKLFVYTDGVPEATDGSGEMFGTDHMITALRSCTDNTPEEILQGVKSAVDSFVGDAEQFDDLTMMCLEYKGP
ncbi:Serine phosphatase RsbU, regulator of sigma subunit [Sarcina sp. DSM 11001]|uniref:PP2C family protein-serine/threonine phosphatase n=1 Tax=Sarcina sp. DSM 11001 TaxID=1798184 RepID=UPI00089047C4|nr:PP2C family protein-serine/threonine phosphatase [Sarcina sp. DSM 11001]SDL13925.1 Serine phosphatase RsbU, regulator of sigma subunit [Sarcina sp. DSM 11001]